MAETSSLRNRCEHGSTYICRILTFASLVLVVCLIHHSHANAAHTLTADHSFATATATEPGATVSHMNNNGAFVTDTLIHTERPKVVTRVDDRGSNSDPTSLPDPNTAGSLTSGLTSAPVAGQAESTESVADAQAGPLATSEEAAKTRPTFTQIQHGASDHSGSATAVHTADPQQLPADDQTTSQLTSHPTPTATPIPTTQQTTGGEAAHPTDAQHVPVTTTTPAAAPTTTTTTTATTPGATKTVFSTPFVAPSPAHAYVAMCAVMRNENCNVLEWIEYHKWLGIGKFYIFDHGSKPPMAEVLSPYLADGTVEYHYFTTAWMDDKEHPVYGHSSARQHLTPQSWAYDSCFMWFGHRHKFIALLDADEFLVIKPQPKPDGSLGKPDAVEFLKKFEETGGVSLHWHLFGPSGHEKRPQGCTLASYTSCMNEEGVSGHPSFKANPLGYMKSIARTEFWKGGCNPHMCSGTRGFVMSDGTPLSIQNAGKIQYHTAYINHYITRSKEEYHLKMQRGTGNTQYITGSKVRSKDWKYFNHVAEVATQQCPEGPQLSADCCPQYCNAQAPQQCTLPALMPEPTQNP